MSDVVIETLEDSEFIDELSEKPARRKPAYSRSPKSYTDDQLRKALLERLIDEITVPVSIASPLAAATIQYRAERTIKATVRVAAKYPGFRAALIKALEGTDYLVIAIFPLAIGASFAVDYGILTADGRISRQFRIDKLYEEVYGELPVVEVNGGFAQPRGMGNVWSEG